MKRSWVTVQEWEGHQVGEIVRVSDVEDWPIYCVNSGWVIPVDFDETNIASGYELAELVPEYWSKEYEDDVLVDPQDESWVYHAAEWQIIEDTARKDAEAITRLENDKLAWEKSCIQGGVDAKAYFNRMISKYEYGEVEQNYFMTDSDFQTIDYLLDHGALETSIALLTAKEVASYFTQPFKEEFINALSNISDSIGDEPV